MSFQEETMKETDKHLLKEIAHLSRLIKIKGHGQTNSKYCFKSRQTRFNPVAYDKFKFFKPGVNPNKYKYSKSSTLTSSKLNFQKSTSGISSSGINDVHTASFPEPYSSAISKSDNNVGRKTKMADSHIVGKIFVNPKVFTSKICGLSPLFEIDRQIDVKKEAEVVLKTNTIEDIACNNAGEEAIISLIMKTETRVPKVRCVSNPYKFKKGNPLSFVNTEIPCNSKAQSTERDVVKVSYQNSLNVKCKKSISIAKQSGKSRLSSSLSNPFRFVRQESVKRNVSLSCIREKNGTIKSKQAATTKAKPLLSLTRSNNQYKLDRRIMVSRPNYSLRKSSKNLKEWMAKNTARRYVITPHSLKKLKDSPKRISGHRESFTTFKRQASKIVKIQGATYESKNKGKTLKRIRTSSSSFLQLSNRFENKFSHTPVTKIASRVLKKCKSTLIKSRQKKNVFCKFYNMFGVCKRLEDGTCRFVHDDRQVVVCAKFIVGKCDNKSCTLSHNLESGRRPLCRFFKNDQCTRSNCPYSHVMSKKQSHLKKLKGSQAANAVSGRIKNVDSVKGIENLSSQPDVVVIVAKPDTKRKNIGIKEKTQSRYYQRMPNTNPVKSIIPRRLPLSLAHVQDSDSDSSESNDSEDSDNSIVTNSSEDECDTGSIKSEVVTAEKCVIESDNENGKESRNSILQSVAIMSCTKICEEPRPLYSESATNSTSEKRQRLLGLQNNLIRRAAAIRNESSASVPD